MSETSVAIGIDLGTTNSCVGVFRNGDVEIIHDERDSKITPSMVTFTESRKFVGTDSRENEALHNPENTVYAIKRLIGREFSDPAIQDDIRHWPFKVVAHNGKPSVQVSYMKKNATFHPEEISAMVLEKLKEIAENYLGHPVKDAVITVPAYFDNNQRQATRAAGMIAGLNVLRLMNEPTAAAVAYGLNKAGGGQRNVLVYDLGGGTFDVSVLSMEGATFQVKSITGDSHLGGEDFDQNLVNHFAQEIKNTFGVDILDGNHTKELRRMARQCEKAKIQLSASPQIRFLIDSLIDGKDFESTISRAKFEELNRVLFDKTMETVNKAILDSGIEKSRIDDVVLVGGSTRIPKIRMLLEDFFTKQRINRNINPDEAVAYGAAMQAAQLAGNPALKVKNMILYDVVPLSLGVAVIGGRMSTIIERNQGIPIRKNKNYTTVVDNQTEMDFSIYEGERALVKDNYLLGQMTLSGIPSEPRGYASVDVTFEIDDDCILHARARDRDSRNEKNLSIVNNAKRLNNDQLMELVRQAEMNRLNDRLITLNIEAMNDLQFYIHDIKSALGTMEFKRCVKPLQRKEVLDEVESMSLWLETASGQRASQTEYVTMREKLEKIWHPISTMVIQTSGKPKSTNKPILFMGD